MRPAHPSSSPHAKSQAPVAPFDGGPATAVPGESDSAAREHLLRQLAERHGVSVDAVNHMLRAVQVGGGAMAQFDHPEFAGSGQWMRGGMTMVSDMFNHQLKARVDALCRELSSLMAEEPGLQPPSPPSGSAHASSAAWWPAELGQPNSAGSQNESRYAFFGSAHRLAIDSGGVVTVYDTRDYRFNGFSQQQGGRSATAFTSEAGTVDLASLPVVWSSATPKQDSVAREAAPPASAASHRPPAGPSPQHRGEQSASGGDALHTLERLATLHEKGIVTAEEFASKKAELLRRI